MLMCVVHAGSLPQFRGFQMTGTAVGYARVSTIGHFAELQLQIKDLAAAGCLKIFNEQVGSADVDRPELRRALEELQPGDVLVVTNLDRVARSTPNLVEVLGLLKRKNADLRVLALNLETTTPAGQQMVKTIEMVARFELSLLRERQQEGIAKAKSEGRYRGRTPTARQKTEEILRLSAEGFKGSAIANQLKISETSVFRILREASIKLSPGR
jgi:DNA invertase Pin-like site-specific DNA recombinase